MNIIKIEKDSIVNGRGIRIVIWETFCPHHCNGCHNPETWPEENENAHKYSDEDLNEILTELKKRYDCYDGITFTGGEPLADCNIDANIEIAKAVKELGFSVWCWTGYTFEELLSNPKFLELAEYLDVLVDGKFEIDKKTLKALWRGSSNQRVINVKQSINEGRVITIID